MALDLLTRTENGANLSATQMDANLTAIENAINAQDASILALQSKAPIASPAFTGTPTAPSPSTGDSTTKFATTAFVQTELPLRRTIIESNVVFYVNPAGSDSNDGLSTASPFLTIQKAVDSILDLDLDIIGPGSPFIQLADGTYASTSTIQIAKRYLTHGLNIVGNLTTPSNVIVRGTVPGGAVINVLDASMNLSGVRVENPSGTPGYVLSCGKNGLFTIANIVFGTSTGHHQIYCEAGGRFVGLGSYTISSGAETHVFCWLGGTVIMATPPNLVVTLTGTPNFTGSFIVSRVGGYVLYYQPTGVSFSGSATGRRYSVDYNATLQCGTSANGFLPGNVAGQITFNGQVHDP